MGVDAQGIFFFGVGEYTLLEAEQEILENDFEDDDYEYFSSLGLEVVSLDPMGGCFKGLALKDYAFFESNRTSKIALKEFNFEELKIKFIHLCKKGSITIDKELVGFYLSGCFS
jgi:hypothetical protein